MIRVAIVEDDAEVQGVLQEYVRRYTRQYGTEFEVTVFADGVDILEDYRAVYDIIFLDVEMKHLDGMTTAERIRQMDADVILIFITNMAQYAIRGYSVGALDYVLKPVPYFAFSQQLLKAVSRLEKRAKHYLTVPVEGGLRRLDTASIYYLESEGHRVHFYTDEGDFSAPGALKAFEEKLADCPFARCNSGYLVNLAQVQAVQQNTVEQFATYADKNGLKRRNLMIRKSHKLLEKFINSRIIYNIMDDQAWTAYINLDDPTIEKALEVFKNNEAFPKKPSIKK